MANGQEPDAKHAEGPVVADELVQLRLRVRELEARLDASPGGCSAANDAARVEAERALALSHVIRRSILDAMPGGVVQVSIEGAVVEANAEARRILGYEYDALKQRYVSDWEPQCIWEDGSACPVAEYPVSKALMTGLPQPPITLGVRRPDGEVMWSVYRAVPIVDPGSGATTGAVVTFIDISERRAAEQALRESQALLARAQRNDAIGRLAGGVAHDFNNLLTVIMTLGNLLADDDTLDHVARELGAEIVEASERGAAITSQLLAYVRQQVASPQVLDLNVVLRHMQTLVRRLIGEDIELVFDLADDLPPVFADSDQLQQVVMNLVLNSCDAMPDGGRLDVTTCYEAGPGEGRVRLSVIDTGEGIDDETLDRVFEPFFTTKPVGSGSGLGLSLVQGIVEQSKGTIEIASSVGAGTRVDVWLPVSTEPLVTAAPTKKRSPREVATLDGIVVLVVEDDATTRRSLALALREAGGEVLLAAMPDDALRLAKQHAGVIDVVVSDVVMPGMTGPQMAESLRVIRPRTQVVFMSGYAAHARPDLTVAVAAGRYLAKPFDPRKLRELVAKLVADRDEP